LRSTDFFPGCEFRHARLPSSATFTASRLLHVSTTRLGEIRSPSDSELSVNVRLRGVACTDGLLKYNDETRHSVGNH
jgi:hypothetical protein